MTTANGVVPPDLAPPPPSPQLDRPTPARQWRRQTAEGDLYVLPGSGNVARLRKAPVTAMITRAGRMPNPISEQVVKLLAEGAPDTATLSLRDATKAQQVYRDHFGAVCEIARLVFVEPRIADDWECPNPDCFAQGGETIATWSGSKQKCPRCGKGPGQAHEVNYEAGEVALTDISDPDLFFAWQFTQQAAAALATFRADHQPADVGRPGAAV